MTGLFSKQFDDIYFSPEDGPAEARHVFLAGNNLPAAWQARDRFAIAETGFGTGLNFLETWKLFEETASENTQLDYVSFELYPLAADEIREALSPWEEEWDGRLARFLALYPLRIPGFHRIVLSERVRLTLVFDDVNEALPRLSVPHGVNAWFLDGFAPSKNPQMWTTALFENMARLSAREATVSTFTVAVPVRRGLEEAGFSVEKNKGFGRKKEMSCGVFSGELAPPRFENETKRIAIVGGGLAGTACAYVLKQQGLHPVLFEKSDHLAAAASGNNLGLYNPRFSAHRSTESDFYSAGFAQTIRAFSSLPDIDFVQCGSLHLINSEDKEKRFKTLFSSWGWPSDHMDFFSAEKASEVAGIEIRQEALFLPDSGCVSPRLLCEAYAGGVDLRLETEVSALQAVDSGWLVNAEPFDAVIFACGAAVKNFPCLSWLPVSTVRGQVSAVASSALSEPLKCNICYGGYIAPSQEGTHVIGATFEKWQNDTHLSEDSHRHNLDSLADNIEGLAQDLKVTGGRAAFRTVSHDHFPVVGPVPDRNAWKKREEKDIPGLYVSTAHGSHGLVSSLAAAYSLVDRVMGCPASQSLDTVSLLQPDRFLRRARRRGEL